MIKILKNTWPQSQRGFTLVDLLVVVGIIGILVGMLIPAVQVVREAGRRTVCSNNLRNLGLAALNFESANNAFPHGSSFRLSHSWNSALLPFLDQEDAYESVDVEVPSDDPLNRDIASTIFSVFSCPSSDKDFPGKTDYCGISGSWRTALPVVPGRHNGILLTAASLRAKPVKLSEVTDGTSQTICIAEGSEVLEINHGFWISGLNCFTHEEAGVNATDRPEDEIVSDHAGGAFAGFCDGSVRFIGEDITPESVAAACTRSAMEVFEHF